jgi:putative transposase
MFVPLRGVKLSKAENPYAKRVHSHVLQTVVQDLDKAFQAFFRRLKAGETLGYPRFKGRNRFHSFGVKELGNGFKVDGRRLKLSGIGRVAVRWHRPLQGAIKTVRISSRQVVRVFLVRGGSAGAATQNGSFGRHRRGPEAPVHHE